MKFSFRDCSIIVSVEDGNGEVHFHLNSEKGETELILKPLWKADIYEKTDYWKKYSEGDYYQHTFNSTPVRVGLGSLLHDFLLENKNNFPFLIENIYSTHPIQDGYMISVAAHTFWDKRAIEGKAVYDKKTDRMKMVWN